MANKSGLNLAITAAMNQDMGAVDAILARMSQRERILKSRKRSARDKKLGKPWKKATLKERAIFQARYEYDPVRRMYIRKAEPENYREILKALKKKSRAFKRRAKQMSRRASLFKRSYTRIHTSAILAAANHMGLFVDISFVDEPEDILKMLLSKATEHPLSKNAIKGLTKYYSRPMDISAYTIGKKPILVVTEDYGIYTFEGSEKLLSKIKQGFIKATKDQPDPPEFDTTKFDNTHLEFMAEVFTEISGGKTESFYVSAAYDKRSVNQVKTKLKKAMKTFHRFSGFLSPKNAKATELKKYDTWVNSVVNGKMTKANQKDAKKLYSGIVSELKKLAKKDNKTLVRKANEYLTTLANKALKKEFFGMVKEETEGAKPTKTPKTPKRGPSGKRTLVPKTPKPTKKKVGMPSPDVGARAVLDDLFEDSVTKSNVKHLIIKETKSSVKVWADKGKFKGREVKVKTRDCKHWGLDLHSFAEALREQGATDFEKSGNTGFRITKPARVIDIDTKPSPTDKIRIPPLESVKGVQGVSVKKIKSIFTTWRSNMMSVEVFMKQLGLLNVPGGKGSTKRILDELEEKNIISQQGSQFEILPTARQKQQFQKRNIIIPRMSTLVGYKLKETDIDDILNRWKTDTMTFKQFNTKLGISDLRKTKDIVNELAEKGIVEPTRTGFKILFPKTKTLSPQTPENPRGDFRIGVPLKSVRNTNATERRLEGYFLMVEHRPRKSFTYEDLADAMGINLDQAGKIIRELRKLNKVHPINTTEWTIGPPGSVPIPKKTTKQKVPTVKKPNDKSPGAMTLRERVMEEQNVKETFKDQKRSRPGKKGAKLGSPFLYEAAADLTETEAIKFIKKECENERELTIESQRVGYFMAGCRRSRDYGFYYIGKYIKDIIDDLLAKERNKVAKTGTKKPGFFYEDPDYGNVGGNRARYGTVRINDEENGPLKEYGATLITMSGGKRGVAIQEQRFKEGDTISIKGKYRRESVTIERHKQERSKQGGLLHRYYYSGRGWVRDFFQEGTKWITKV